MVKVKGDESSGKSVDSQPKLYEKVFVVRESLLTELFQINHIQAFRNMVLAVLISALINTVLYDITTYGEFAIHPKFDLFIWVMEGVGACLLFNWLPMFLSISIGIYFGFYLYAAFRNSMGSFKGLFDRVFLILYVSFALAFTVLPILKIGDYTLGNRVLILFEQVRLAMKAHAFVRSNIQRVLDSDRAKNESSSSKPIQCPEFSKFLYFLFAPTLLYRDNYPRSTHPIRWNMVAVHMVEVFACVAYVNTMFDQMCIPIYSLFKIKELTLTSFIRLHCLSIIPSGVFLITAFFFLLHSWQNLFAELLKFGDRQFYTDWWNSRTFNEYYRKWNILVQDWLYHYIFKDLYNAMGRRNKMLANFGVILISGIVHEYIITFTLGFFYPVLFILFCVIGFILLFVRVKNPQSVFANIVVWCGLFNGASIYMTAFTLEWYARHSQECPRTIDTSLDYFIPRSIACAIY